MTYTPRPAFQTRKGLSSAIDCGAEIVFDKKQKAPSSKLMPLDPFFDNQPHWQYCMYMATKDGPDTESLLSDFISIIQNQRPKNRVLFAVGKAKE